MPGTLSEDLRKIRREIDAIDRRILALLEERAERALRVGAVKRRRGVPPYDPEREDRVLRRILRGPRGILPRPALTAVYREIISASRSLQGPLRVACLGGAGRRAAAGAVGSSATLLEWGDPDVVLRTVEQGEADLGLLPWEAASGGIDRESLDRVVRRPVRLWGECLAAAPPGATRSWVFVARSPRPPTGRDCTTLYFRLPEGSGGPVDLLGPFARGGIACRRFDFRAGPPGQGGEALGVFEGRPEAPPFERALRRAEGACSFVKVLGSFPPPR